MMRAREISSSRRSPPESTPGALAADAARKLEYLASTRLVPPLSPAAAGLSMQIAAHEQVFLDRHVGEYRVVLQDVGDAGAPELVRWRPWR